MTKEEADQFEIQMEDLRNYYEQRLIRLQIQITELEARLEGIEKKKI